MLSPKEKKITCKKNPPVLDSAYHFLRQEAGFSPLCYATAVWEPRQEKIIQLIFSQRSEESVSKYAHGAAPWRNDAAVSPLTQSLFKGKLCFEAFPLRHLLLGTTCSGEGGVKSNCLKVVGIQGREKLPTPNFSLFLELCGLWMAGPMRPQGMGRGQHPGSLRSWCLGPKR